MTVSRRAAKQALRERILTNRTQLQPAALVEAANRICDVMLETPEVAAATRIAAYISVGREPGTGPLIEALSAAGVEILLPIRLVGGDVDWAVYEGPRSLVPAARGLLQPRGTALGPTAISTVGVIVAPGLAADRYGGRLGRGGGSYDRVLARADIHAFSCILLHDGEVLDMPVPQEPHDVPVDAAATPTGLHRFHG